MDKTIKEVVHETVKGLHEIGLVDKVTMRDFDALCIPKLKALGPKEIKIIRDREKVSQPVLAMHLNVSPHTVKHWEQGTKHPTGSALKLLNIVLEKGLIAIEEEHVYEDVTFGAIMHKKTTAKAVGKTR
jgi:putative transcriptional regulator